jgi:hypothetical protein
MEAARPARMRMVAFRCLCGKLHTLMRGEVLEGLNVDHWKCAGCKRRFVIACTPSSPGHSEEFWPLYLEDLPATGSTREEGLPAGLETPATVPPELRFQCRCGSFLVGKSRTFGHPSQCPKCDSPLVLRVGYRAEDGSPVALVSYPDPDEGARSP